MGKESNCVVPEIQSYGEGVKLSLPSPLNAHLSLPTNPSPHGEGVKLSSPCNAKAILLSKFFSTWGRVKLSSAKMQSYPSRQILPTLCSEGYFPIMQNFYESFPTNLYFFFFIFHFIFIYLFIFTSFYYFFLFLKVSFQFSLLFWKTWNSSPKGKNYSPAFGRIIEE